MCSTTTANAGLYTKESKGVTSHHYVPPTQPPEDLNEFWRERVDAARRAYECAQLEATRATESITCSATSQEIHALIEAHRREAAALGEYMRALEIFHQRTVKGGKPET
jgi:hypothetical protein